MSGKWEAIREIKRRYDSTTGERMPDEVVGWLNGPSAKYIACFGRDEADFLLAERIAALLNRDDGITEPVAAVAAESEGA